VIIQDQNGKQDIGVVELGNEKSYKKNIKRKFFN